MGSHQPASLELKMYPTAMSLVGVLLLLLQVQQEEATFALAIPAFSLTATQVTALAAFGALAKLGGDGAGLALRGDSGRSSSRRPKSRRPMYRHNHRGRREANQVDLSLEKLTINEPENCFKMVFCAVSTGQIDNPELNSLVTLFGEDVPELKFMKAAQYGRKSQSIAKCEKRYKCSLGMEIIQRLFTQQI